MAVDIYYNFYRIVDTTFEVEASGLKKNSRYYFYFGDMDKGNECKPFGGELGDPLYSDANGKLKFNFYFNFDEKTGYTGSHFDDTYYQDGNTLGGEYNQLLFQFDLVVYTVAGPRSKLIRNAVQLKSADGKVVASTNLTGTTNLDYSFTYYSPGNGNNQLRDVLYWAPQWWLDAYGLTRPEYPPEVSGP